MILCHLRTCIIGRCVQEFPSWLLLATSCLTPFQVGLSLNKLSNSLCDFCVLSHVLLPVTCRPLRKCQLQFTNTRFRIIQKPSVVPFGGRAINSCLATNHIKKPGLLTRFLSSSSRPTNEDSIQQFRGFWRWVPGVAVVG